MATSQSGQEYSRMDDLIGEIFAAEEKEKAESICEETPSASDATSPAPPPPPVLSIPQCQELRDIGWTFPELKYVFLTAPDKNTGNYKLFCFCGQQPAKCDGRIVCAQRVCGFQLPGTEDMSGLYFYIERVMTKLLNLGGTVPEYLARCNNLWLQPVCKCGHVLKIRIYPALKTGMFWYAECENPVCDVQKMRAYEMKFKFKAFFDAKPNVKNTLMGIMSCGL